MKSPTIGLIQKIIKVDGITKENVDDFCADLENALCREYRSLFERQPAFAERLNDDVLDICEEVEMGYDPQVFGRKLGEAYDRALTLIDQKGAPLEPEEETQQ